MTMPSVPHSIDTICREDIDFDYGQIQVAEYEYFIAMKSIFTNSSAPHKSEHILAKMNEVNAMETLYSLSFASGL